VGVKRKFFGAFTERAFWIERIRVAAGARWVSTEDNARRLIVVLAGAGEVADRGDRPLAAIQAEPVSADRSRCRGTSSCTWSACRRYNCRECRKSYDIVVGDGRSSSKSPSRASDPAKDLIGMLSLTQASAT